MFEVRLCVIYRDHDVICHPVQICPLSSFKEGQVISPTDISFGIFLTNNLRLILSVSLSGSGVWSMTE